MFASICSGVTVGAKRLTTFPFRSTRNFSKFHFISLSDLLFPLIFDEMLMIKFINQLPVPSLLEIALFRK